MLLYDFGDVDALVAQLRRALTGERALATAAWAATFQRELAAQALFDHTRPAARHASQSAAAATLKKK